VDSLICLAPFWEKFFLENFSNKNIEIINNVIPKPINWHSYSANGNSSHINFLFLGRIGHRKGIFDILKVISEKKDFFTGKMKLSVGGDGETEKLKEFIKEHQLEDIVEYVGWIQGNEKNNLLTKSDVYILPSYSEGLPISILEAMSYKLPVISTPVGGIPEIVINDENGKLVTPGNLSEIGAAISYFIDNPSKVKEFGKTSYEKIGPYFPDFVSAQLQEVYNTLLSKK
jgi:glycosyltransferase involved in cell wall biosynthesis